MHDFLSMFSTRQCSSENNSWKIRPINGFEKHLFPNTHPPPKRRRNTKIDPARFIYPRDAMGDMLHRKKTRITPFYLPNYSFVQTRLPAWTIKNVYFSKQKIPLSNRSNRWRCK